MVTELFLFDVVEEYGEHPVSTDGGTWYPQQACRSLKLNHHIHSSYEKSLIIERTAVYQRQNRNLDDYFPIEKRNVS